MPLARQSAAEDAGDLLTPEYPMPAEILRLSTAQMADILVAEGLWEVFTEQFPLVRIGDDFYDRDGKVV